MKRTHNKPSTLAMFVLAGLCGLILYRRQFGVLALWSGNWEVAFVCALAALLFHGAGARLAGVCASPVLYMLSLLVSSSALPAGYFAAVQSCTELINEAAREKYPDQHPPFWQELSDKALAKEYIDLRVRADGAEPGWLTFLALRNPSDFSPEPIGAEAAAVRTRASRLRWLGMWGLLAAGGIIGVLLGSRKAPSGTVASDPPGGGVDGIPVPAL